MDLITLALAKNYTDKQIEKAEMGDGGGEIFTVTYTDNEDEYQRIDKTFEEIKAAIDAGMVVQCKQREGTAVQVLPLGVYTNQGIMFGASGSEDVLQVSIYFDGRAELSVMPYSMPVATPETLGGVQPVAKTADMTQPCGVDEFGRLFTAQIESGGNAVPEGCGTLDTIIDFTSTEGATEIRIPISTEEMAAKLRSATEFRVTIDVPRDVSDTETTTAGKVTLGLYVGWNAVILSDMSIIPEPTLTYKNKGRAIVAIFRNPGLTTAALPTLLTTTTQVGSTADVVLKSAVVRADSVDASKNHYVYITATQNMAAGTRIVLGVRI